MFKDVLHNHPYYAAIKAAFENGLVAGYPDGTLGADEPIKTDRMVALLWKLYLRIGANVATMADARVQQLIAASKPAVVQVVSDAGVGAGSIIHPDGFVLTNEHVVRNSAGYFPNLTVRVITDPNGWERHRDYPATVVDTDNFDDLALLRIPAGRLPVLRIVNRVPVEGQTVVVIGHPCGYQDTSSKGIVTQDASLLGGLLDGRFQVDAAINPGNSGGPVLNLEGELIGVAEAKVSEADNIGFAICAQQVKQFLDRHLSGLVE